MKRRYDILSLFPDYFHGPFNESILKRAQDRGLIDIHRIDIREFSDDPHRRVDDRPYGGGPGMVMMPGPVTRAIRHVKTEKSHVVYVSPQGSVLNAQKARELADKEHVVFLCGHYEGIDERILADVDEEISIGDYVLTNGCLAAIVMIDVMSRFVPGVLGNEVAAENDSFEKGGRLDHPHFTRPVNFEGRAVPEVLQNGNHQKISAWRQHAAEEKTKRVRPDLYKLRKTTV